MRKALRRLPLILTLAFALDLGAQEDQAPTGPTTLVIQYHSHPGQRAQLRQAGIGAVHQFSALKNEGVLAGYHVLFSRYVNSNSWDMLVVLNFRTFADVAKWKAVERRTPAGLSAEGLAATSAIFTYSVDGVRSNASDASVAQPVYMVIPYTVSVATPVYLQYLDDYVRPQFEGWMREGVLTRYEMFLQRYTASRPWDSLILLQYKDDQSLGLRETVVAKVRQQLADNPVWKKLSVSKQNIRAEKEVAIADELSGER